MQIEYHWRRRAPTTPAPPPGRGVPLGARRTYLNRGSFFPTTIDPRLAEQAVSDEELLIWKTRGIAYGIIAPTLIAVGMLGNLLTILILRQKRFKGMTYTFFRVLALSDLIGLFFSISFINHILHPVTPVYATAYWYAHFEMFATNVPMTVSVLTVVCITVDRFFSVCRPTEFKKIHKIRYARIGMGVSLLVACLMWLPTSFIKVVSESTECESFNFDKVPDSNRTYYVACMEKNVLDSTGYMFYSWTRQTVLTFIPIAVLLILNILIIRGYMGVVRRREDMRGQQLANDSISQRTGQQNMNRDDQNLIKMLYAIMITFFITLLPPGIANAMYTEFLSTDLQYEIFRAVANDLEILNHTLNFYLYITLSKPLRAAIREYFKKKKHYLDESLSSTYNRIRKSGGKADEFSPKIEESSSKRRSKSSKEEIVNNPLRPISNISLVTNSSEFVLSPGVSPKISLDLTTSNRQTDKDDEQNHQSNDVEQETYDSAMRSDKRSMGSENSECTQKNIGSQKSVNSHRGIGNQNNTSNQIISGSQRSSLKSVCSQNSTGDQTSVDMSKVVLA